MKVTKCEKETCRGIAAILLEGLSTPIRGVPPVTINSGKAAIAIVAAAIEECRADVKGGAK